MNTKYLLTATVAGGLISLVLVNTPFVQLINLLVCLGFWVGPLAAVWLYRRLDGHMEVSQSLVIGMLAGAWHGLFGLLLSPLGLAGAGGLLRGMSDVVPAADVSSLEVFLSGLGVVLFNLIGVLVDIAFGLVGGLLGGVLFGSRRVTR